MNLTQVLLLLIACILFPPLIGVLLAVFLILCVVACWPSAKAKPKTDIKQMW